MSNSSNHSGAHQTEVKKEKEKLTGMERLASLGGVLVKQKADELEDVTGIEKENKYKVRMKRRVNYMDCFPLSSAKSK